MVYRGCQKEGKLLTVNLIISAPQKQATLVTNWSLRILPWKQESNIIYCPKWGILESERHAVSNYSGTTGMIEQTGTGVGSPYSGKSPPFCTPASRRSLQGLSVNGTCIVLMNLCFWPLTLDICSVL